MIHKILTSVIVAALAIWALGSFLEPNDLRGCSQAPDGLSNCQTADAIVAISGGDTDARVSHAVDLYKNGWAPKLVFCGAAQDKSGPSNAAAMKRIAVASGVNENDIILDEYSETTQQNAVNASTILADNNINSVILVTSGYHQRRALLEFDKRIPSDKIINSPVISDKDWSPMWWLTLRGWGLALGELVKISVFYASGVWQ